MSAPLHEEFAAFRRWCTLRVLRAQQDPIAPVTAAKYEAHLRYAGCDASAIAGVRL